MVSWPAFLPTGFQLKGWTKKWPWPTTANMNQDELGDLGLSAAEEASLVAFMKTLNDGYLLPKK